MKLWHQLIVGIVVVVVTVGVWVVGQRTRSVGPTETARDVEVVADGLEIPWELAFLPSGDLLVTERPGRLLRIGADRQAIVVEGVQHQGEGGLLGLALHPKFSENGLIYLYLTTAVDSGLQNRIERYRLDGTQLTDRRVIIENIPGAPYHDGGRIAFGPDGYLYVTTGDAANEANAQDRDSLAGKILRVTDDGSIPAENPFGSAVYSLGHRNPQGIAWDSSGQLWATEHGQSGLDELNRIEKGGNYGWPTIQGDASKPGLRKPVVHSGADTTWAPSGMMIDGSRLLFAGLRGEAIYMVDLTQSPLQPPRTLFQGQFGRLRTIVRGPEGAFYLLTNNRDGRGEPRPGDDKLIRVPAETFSR